MNRILVAFATREGHTERIAHHVARGLEDRGCVVRLINLTAHDEEAGADDYDATIIAGSVHRGRQCPELTGFIMRHGPAIRARPSAFLSISLSAASHDKKEREALDELVRHFLFDIGWQPDYTEHVAGAICDRQLGVIEQFVLHRAAEMHGESLHPSGNTEFTDWAKLDAFIARFAKKLESQVRQAAE